MPQVGTIISGAASLGVLAGVVSGIFYLVLTGIRWAGRVRAALQAEEERKSSERCASCGRAFATTAARSVVCTVCGRSACYDLPCSRPAPIGWSCVVCHVKRTVVVDSSSGSWTDVKSDEENKSNAAEESSDIDGETVQVREFIEKLVEDIVGGPLDGVTVGKLSSHSVYDEFFAKYHELLCQALARLGFFLQLSLSSKNGSVPETPSTAHSALVQLIEKIAREALRLPNLSHPSSPVAKSTSETPVLNGKSYEDILSTAILNKIIEKYQLQNGYVQNGVDSNRNSLKMKHRRSHEDEDSDWSDVSRTDPLSLKIEEHIEEVTTAYGSSSDEPEDELNEPSPKLSRRVPFPEFGVDIVDASEVAEDSDGASDSCATDIVSTQSTWEENWLFQKKKLKSASSPHHPVPVPMLVPNPSQDFRALIGGVDADDISDLSECSDSVLEEAMSENTDDPGKVLEMIDALNRDKIIEQDTEISPSETNSRSEETTVPTTQPGVMDEAQSSSDTQVSSPDSLEVDEPNQSSSSSPSLVQQDRDVSVDYEVISQIDRTPVPRPRTLELVAINQPEAEPEVGPEEKAIICPIAEREKAKWNNAIEMKDNPYTSESINKRGQTKQPLYLNGNKNSESVDFPVELANVEVPETPERKYSRDYYIKASRSPTGDPEASARNTDSPVSLRSEASLEEDKKTANPANTLQLWDDLLPAQQPRQTTVRARRSSEEAPKDIKNEDLATKVAELKKNFVSKKPPLPSRSKSVPAPKKEPPKEPDVDYSLTPVSQIISNLSNISNTVPDQTNKQEEIFREVAHIRRDSLTKAQPVELPKLSPKSSHLEKQPFIDESVVVDQQKPETSLRSRKPIKPVHSLTARSIPKDFREGLKNNSQQVKSPKGRVGEIYSARDNNALPPLNFDVKGKKKFWENIAKERN